MTSQTELPTSAVSNPLRSRLFQILEVARPGDVASRLFDLVLILLILSNVLAILLDPTASHYDLLLRSTPRK